MRKNNRYIFRILLTLLILVLTVGLSLAAYIAVWRSEEEHCGHTLASSSQSISKEIVTRMKDNGSILQLAAGALLEGDSYSSPEDISNHVNKYLDLTIFSRIDILLPDNTILMGYGETIDGTGKVSSFQEVFDKGIHLSDRAADFLTGRQSVYYDVPVADNGEPIAVMVGVIDCEKLPQYFSTNIYGGEADCMLVDRNDGSIIMDTMLSEEHGNFFDYTEVQTLYGHGNVDIVENVRNAETGFFAYKSPRSGTNMYMFYAPVEGYNWQLLVMVSEEQAFAGLSSLRNSLTGVATVECIIILLFVILNVYSSNRAYKHKEEAEYQLHKSNVLIECVTELSSNGNIDSAIEHLMGIVNGYFEGDRTYIFDIDYDNKVTNNLYEFAIEGVTKEIDNLQNVPLSSIEYWIEEFRRSGIFYISDIDSDVIHSSNTYEILAAQGIHSLIAVPLKRSDLIIGFMGVDNPKTNYNDLTLLSSVQFFITEAMERKTAQEALTNMSYTDTLTRLHNRNKFNHVCDEHHRYPRYHVGVAFFDLDGLKHVNDTQGHEAGDRLIISTADNIRSIFSGNCYRIGGDEFAVILPDVGREEFEGLVNEVRRLMEANDISVAIGTSWREVGINLKVQLKEADKMMYVEKAEHRRLLAEKIRQEKSKTE
ncbi:MAG: GGDEF domain-containing protein [Ruminococcaceae bacterium]|nr:GGDEF domain-containing protein [Oscillospiraceae bacterium]